MFIKEFVDITLERRKRRYIEKENETTARLGVLGYRILKSSAAGFVLLLKSRIIVKEPILIWKNIVCRDKLY